MKSILKNMGLIGKNSCSPWQSFCSLIVALAAFPIFWGYQIEAICGQEPTAEGTSQKDPKQSEGALPSKEEGTFSVTKLTKLGRPSIVVIGFHGRDGKPQGMGTGFVISKDGLVATNLHVIGEARSIFVQTAEGKSLKVKEVYASDRTLDLAVLRVEGLKAPPLELGDSTKVEQGESVIALGNPQGLKHSVVSGVVSSRREMAGRGMLQLAIPIEPGNSGGPVLDENGKVLGIVTMKSLVTENLGFAVEVAELKRLLLHPNTVPMERWLTIGSIDKRHWKPRFGGSWLQRSGKVIANGSGEGFGGRMICQSLQAIPEVPYEVSVQVKLDSESGAAGLIFGDEGEHRHFGFYPSAGKMRLVRFDGPDVLSWQILEDEPSRAYRADEWNLISVRVEAEGVKCFVNGELQYDSKISIPAMGHVGLVKFREPGAEFRRFAVKKASEGIANEAENFSKLRELVDSLPSLAKVEKESRSKLLEQPASAERMLELRVKELKQRVAELEKITLDVKCEDVLQRLEKLCGSKVQNVDLLRSGLVLAQLDESDVDVEAYVSAVDRMAEEIKAKFPEGADDKAKLTQLHQYLFEENGFHGSRVDYYHRANSYLNRVIDDREGIPITLSVLYMELAKRVGLMVEGVGLPGHFVVRVKHPGEAEGVIVDAFDRGKELTKAEAEALVKEQTGSNPTDEMWQAVTERAILQRMLQNLMGVAQQQGDREALRRYLSAMLVMDPTLVRQRGMKATLDFETGRIQESLKGLDWFLENSPEGIDLNEIRELRARFERALQP